MSARPGAPRREAERPSWRARAAALWRRRPMLIRPVARSKGRGRIRAAGLAAALGARALLAVAAVVTVAAAAGAAPWAVERTRAWIDGTPIVTREASAGALFRQLARLNLIDFDPATFQITPPPQDLALRMRLGARDTALDASLARWPSPLTKAHLEAVSQLYSGRAGLVLRQEFDIWNAAHLAAAIRDDRRTAIDADRPTILPIGAKPNAWDVSAFRARDGAESPQNAELRGALSLDLYGFLGWGDRRWPAPDGDWRAAAPESAEDALIRFSSPPLTGGDLVVDVIGRSVEVVGARIQRRRPLCEAYAASARRPDEDGQLRPVEIAERRTTPDCAEAALQERVVGPISAHRLVLRPEDGAARVAVSVRPAGYVPPRMRRYRAARLTSRTYQPPYDAAQTPQLEAGRRAFWRGWARYRGGESLTLYCRGRDAEATCAFDWTPRRRPTRGAELALRIPTADGAELAAPRDARAVKTPDAADVVGLGVANQTAAELGLAPLVGLGVADRLGASGALARIGGGAERSAPLTLREDVQRIAIEELRRAVIDAPDRGMLPATHDPIRRAAFVMLDASDDPRTRGAVLAAVDFPAGAIRDRAAWNILGYDLWRPLKSDLAPRAWARVDAQATPGSTFKTLTALALIRDAALKEGTDATGPIHRAIQGVGDPAQAPGLPLPEGVALEPSGSVRVPGRFYTNANHDCATGRFGPRGWRPSAKICNFVFQGRLEPHAYAHLPPQETTCPVRPGGALDAPQLGLCEATTTSLNSWFILAGLSVDGPGLAERLAAATEGLPRGGRKAERIFWERIAAYEPSADPARRSALSALAQRFPHEAARNLLRLPSPPQARFRADPMLIDSDRASANPLHTLALNAIGQNVQAAPLAVASLYATVASGCRVDPFLSDTRRAAAEEGCPPIFFAPDPETGRLSSEAYARETHAQLLMARYLVPGLKAVVNSRRGTADTAFQDADYAHAMRGKTGTAQVPIDVDPETGKVITVNSVWFAGWIEAEGLYDVGAGQGLRRKVAFACMVSHGAPRKASGGRVCAPIVKAIIDRLRAAPERPGGAAKTFAAGPGIAQ